MKNTILTVLVILALTMVATVSKATDANSMFNDYEITQVSNQDLQNGADKAWVLTYNANESPITITLHQTKRSKYYVVKGDNFEIAYECCKKGFGATYVKSAYSEVPFVLTNSVINEGELSRQKLLTTSQPTEKEALDLIAAYLPDLVNASYKHLLN